MKIIRACKLWYTVPGTCLLGGLVNLCCSKKKKKKRSTQPVIYKPKRKYKIKTNVPSRPRNSLSDLDILLVVSKIAPVSAHNECDVN